MRLVQFELGGAVHCGVELQGCVCSTHPTCRVAGLIMSGLLSGVLCREVVDLTAANIAANTLALAKMGDIGLMAAAAVRAASRLLNAFLLLSYIVPRCPHMYTGAVLNIQDFDLASVHTLSRPSSPASTGSPSR